MTDLPVTLPAPSPTASTRASRFHTWIATHALESFLLACIAGALAWDRLAICRQYLFRYTDEDQTAMWYAAHDLLHGRIAEPAFYGQAYNNCLEGFLAVPLVALHVPYNIACPLVTVLLGLLPFLLLAAVALRRRHFLAAAGALLIPLVLPDRYAMICGIPRGFINGIAIAAIPMLLLLPRAALTPTPSLQTPLSTRRRSLVTAARYFFAAALSVIAFQTNPSCTILLVPVWTFTLLTQFLNWRMWLFSPLGLLAAAPYPWYVYHFYHVTHPDYVLYLRDEHFSWGHRFFTSYIHLAFPTNGPSPVFADFLPPFIPATHAGLFLITLAALLAVALAVRLRLAALCSLLAGIAIILLSFAYDRVAQGLPSNTVSYSYSRMWLAIPVLFAWLLFLLSTRRKSARVTPRPWLTRTALSLLAVAAIAAAIFNIRRIPDTIDAELNADGFVICPAVPVADLYAMARQIKNAADAQHADLLIVFGDDRQKHIDYAIPALLNLETLFPDFERRTFRFIEESRLKHYNILIMFNPRLGTPVTASRLATLTPDGAELPPHTTSTTPTHFFILPAINVLDAHGQSLYDLPNFRYILPRLIPAATPDNPRPYPLVDR